MLRFLSTCDICVQPDPKNPLNDISTMNMVMEYMALGRFVVSYVLVKTQYSAAECALYAVPNSIEDLSNKLWSLVRMRKCASKWVGMGGAALKTFWNGDIRRKIL